MCIMAHMNVILPMRPGRRGLLASLRDGVNSCRGPNGAVVDIGVRPGRSGTFVRVYFSDLPRKREGRS